MPVDSGAAHPFRSMMGVPAQAAAGAPFPMPTIHAFVISWQGQEHKAERMAGQVLAAADHVTVLHSCPPDRRLPERPGWEQLPFEAFYGVKFSRALALNRGDVMLHLHADADTPDWTQVVRRCREAFQHVSALGVWAPDVDYTPFPLEEVRIGPLTRQELLPVAHTDSIAWALSAPVIARMRLLDLSVTSMGWGVDWAAICYCISHGLLVLRDRTLKLSHPRGSGYERDEAERQMLAFLPQLTPPELVVRALLADHIEYQRQLLGRPLSGLP
jgi:hypothetical protein